MHNITIIIIFAVVIYIIYSINRSREEHLTTQTKKKRRNYELSVDNFAPLNEQLPSGPRIFTEGMFHSDYMDIITAFNNLSPNQRQVFNIDNQPSKVSNVSPNIVGDIVDNFIGRVNEYVKESVPTVRNPSCGWDEPVPDPNVKSGWDKIQESLGLPGSIYDKFAGQSTLHLIGIQKVTKYETDKEIKYECILIVQKEGVSDQLVVKADFVLTKGLKNPQIHVVIEFINIMGFLSVNGMSNDRLEADDFYNFKHLEKNNMTASNTIMRELLKKYELRNRLMQEKIDQMEPAVYDTYQELPFMDSYESHKVTRNITDDIMNPYDFERPHFSNPNVQAL